MQVHAALGVIQVEERAIWQGLAPQEFVVRRSVGLSASGSLPGGVSVLKSNDVSISMGKDPL